MQLKFYFLSYFHQLEFVVSYRNWDPLDSITPMNPYNVDFTTICIMYKGKHFWVKSINSISKEHLFTSLPYRAELQVVLV